MEEQTSELAALYALGALGPAESREAEELLADEAFSDQVLAHRETVGALGLLVSGPPPPPSLKSRLFERVVEPAAESLPKGLAALVATSSVPWKPSSMMPGVYAKRLFQDPNGNISWLVKLDPGAVYPRHRHSAMEHCLMLEGEVQFDDYVLRAGDYEVALPDTDHSAFKSRDGAVLFIIANKHDEIF